MNSKKILSLILAVVLLAGIVLPGIAVVGAGEEQHQHTFGQWSFDTQKGTQSRVCSSCSETEVLYGTTNKVTQVTNPVVGGQYYLVANVNGELRTFTTGGVTETTPYSLKTVALSESSKKVTLEDPTLAVEGQSTGFQLTFDNGGTLTRIYFLPSGSAVNTGTHSSAAYRGRHTVEVAEVNGVSVVRKVAHGNNINNNYVLVVKRLAKSGGEEWRMQAVPASELSNVGVYPVMLANLHTHTYGNTYESDNSGHWRTCDCGNISPKEDHNYVNDPVLGYGVCVCGKDNVPHDCQSADGKWYTESNKHYQICGKCGEKIQEGNHTYGNWIYDAENGTQSKICSACQNVGEILYGTTDKFSQVTAPTIGSTYYLAANVAGNLKYFCMPPTGGSVTNTSPYSLYTTQSPANSKQVKLLSAITSGKGSFQLSFMNGSTETFIYCHTTGTGTTATSSTSYYTPDRASFFVDEVNGVSVLRKYSNNYILAVKQLQNSKTGTKLWHMQCVPEAELANAGVYPVMLLTKHVHDFGGAYEFDGLQHWKVCACDGISQRENHNFVVDPALGYGVCVCGADQAPHDCKNTDGKWYVDGDKHYQLCDKCGERVGEAKHKYESWTFNTEKGTQSKLCTVCQNVGETLHGTDSKVTQVTEPVIGQSYHMVANVDGIIYYFRHGVATDTVPYSLNVSNNVNHNWVLPVTLEDSALATEGASGIGFQLTYIRPDTQVLSRIYCYNAESSNPAIDTGINTVNYKNRHTFFMDEVNGVKVIRKIQNNNILAVKFNQTTQTYRLVAVTETELGGTGVYPVMFANLHQHSYGNAFGYDENQHWHFCSTCDGKADVADHEFHKNAAGDRVCDCGYVQPPHDCQSADNVWYSEAGKHYQLCGVCQEKIKEANHTYGQWSFDTAKGTQTAACTVCNITDTLHGTGVKGYQELNPKLGESYYLAANVNGKLYFFRHGTVTDTTPYSLWVTDDVNHDWVQTLTVEDPYVTDEKITTGFQLAYNNPTNDVHTRIYCYDVLKDSETVTGQTGVMDTGVNSGTAYKNRHNFSLKEIGGQTVLSKTGNDNVLVVKYDPAVEAYRMLGVPASELSSDGVYPVMLMSLHEHTHTDTKYQKDASGHWFKCPCGGQSNYEDHTVSKWTYTKKPTQTTPGRKTGTCTTCGGKAVVDVPALVAEGYYYLTGKLGGNTYYFRDKTGDESVEHTAPFSLLTSTKEKDALKVDVAWNEKANTYVLSYTVTRTLNIYMGDVNGSTIQKDGKVDLASSATTDEGLITYRWDPAAKRFYQMEGGVRYVIAFKKMTLTNGKTAVRMLAVPESELGADVVPMQLKLVHLHNFGEKWQGDAIDHWHECSCGIQKDLGVHAVPQWKVEKKATTTAAGRKSGTCTVCKQKVVNAIPMLTDKVVEPENGGQYYLTGVLNGKQYYFCHTPIGGSVADTYPYSLYTDPGTGFVTPLNVKAKSGNYRLSYGTDGLHLYISGDGVGMTKAVENTALVDFQWDDENKVLYQMEGNVKHVLVFKMMRNNKGDNLARITSMPLERALIDPEVAIARFTTKAPEAPVVSNVPKDATLLGDAQEQAPAEDVPGDGAVYHSTAAEDSLLKKLIIAVAILAIAIPVILLLLAVLKKGGFGLAFFRKWNVWAGISFALAGIVLLAAMLLPGMTKPENPGLEAFTIVANDSSMADAEALAVELYEDHGVSLNVVHCNDFDGDYGIFVNVTGFNSYGGYKYSISNQKDADRAGVYIDGTGPALQNAISKWKKSAKKNDSFPFGITEDVVGYEWNTGDVNMTGLGFTLQEMNNRELYEGVELYELKYDSFAYGKNTGYVVVVDADAPVEMKVSAGQWDENSTTDNPGEKFTVEQHSKRLADAGYEVVAITNAGFYDLNTTMTYVPWGMQIVDGVVKKEPNKDNPKNTDNWFAQTADGKFVISNTDGYYETYETTLSDGVGGGLVLMENGKPCFTSTTPDYRTVVAITTDGDLAMLTISGANYAVVLQAFMDIGLEVDCILNLDGGGSTTLHTLTEEGKLKQFICETPVERQVADAIAIVKKK